MQWFKHSTGSHDDPDISDAEDKFGDAGYVVFFKILELYGQEFNQLKNGGEWHISKTFIRRKLRKSWTKVEQILNFYSESQRIIFKYDKNDPTKIIIKIPKFLDISSNWIKRKSYKKDPPPTEHLQSTYRAPTAKEEEKKKKRKETQDLSVVDMVIEEEKISDEKSSFSNKTEEQKQEGVKLEQERIEKEKLNQLIIKYNNTEFGKTKRRGNGFIFFQKHNRSNLGILIASFENIFKVKDSIDYPDLYLESIFKNKNAVFLKLKADTECERHKGLTRERRTEVYG